jgi:hypothetical protein
MIIFNFVKMYGLATFNFEAGLYKHSAIPKFHWGSSESSLEYLTELLVHQVTKHCTAT